MAEDLCGLLPPCPPPPGAAAGAEPVAARSSVCEDCGEPLACFRRDYSCPRCGWISPRAPAETVGQEGAGRRSRIERRCVKAAPELRVRGQSSALYQKMVDRGAYSGEKAAYAQLLEELQGYNEAYRSSTRRSFGLAVLEELAREYMRLRAEHRGFRCDRKRCVLAALLQGIFRRRLRELPAAYFADFVQLDRRSGVSHGHNILHRLGEVGLASEEVALPAVVHTALRKLGAAEIPDAGAAALELVAVAEELGVGIRSSRRSKAVTAVYEVLRRAGREVTIQAFARACGIRENTMATFLVPLRRYHSKFADVYRRHGLVAKRWARPKKQVA